MHRVRNERTFFLFDKTLFITKKRGDHFVYKGHIPVTRPPQLLCCLPPCRSVRSPLLRVCFIRLQHHPCETVSRTGPLSLPLTPRSPCPQCSSLMLIESTRDSLCFTVTHYKHSKQQYSIQVRRGQGAGAGVKTDEHIVLAPQLTPLPEPSVSIYKGVIADTLGLWRGVQATSQRAQHSPVPPFPSGRSPVCAQQLQPELITPGAFPLGPLRPRQWRRSGTGLITSRGSSWRTTTPPSRRRSVPRGLLGAQREHGPLGQVLGFCWGPTHWTLALVDSGYWYSRYTGLLWPCEVSWWVREAQHQQGGD